MNEIVRTAREHGLFSPTPARAALQALSHLALYSAGFAGMAFGESAPVRFCFALLWGAGVFYFGAWLHDLAHYSVVKSRRLSDWLGLCAGNLISNIDFYWWQEKHNRHHKYPNNADRDPDHFTAGWLRTIHLGAQGRPWWILRFQGLYIWIVVLFASLNVSVQSLVFQALQWKTPGKTAGKTPGKKCDAKRRGVRALFSAAHYVTFFAILITAGVGPGESATLFICGRLTAGGIFAGLGMMNHVGRFAYYNRDRPASVFVRQVATGRNLGDSPIVFYLTAGLNHHIEHHLFPSMSRFHHRVCSEFVREYCRAHQVPYEQVGLLRAVRDVSVYLGALGRDGAGAAALLPDGEAVL